MSQRTDVDALAQLPNDEFEERIRAAAERMELRSNRALYENRDMTERENQLSSDDRDELEALRKAEALRNTPSGTNDSPAGHDNTPRPKPADVSMSSPRMLTRGVPYRGG
jgi:hypothetical protein